MKCVLSYCNILHYCNYYITIYCSHVKPTAIHQASAASRLSMSPASAGTCGASWSLYPWTIKGALNRSWTHFEAVSWHMRLHFHRTKVTNRDLQPAFQGPRLPKKGNGRLYVISLSPVLGTCLFSAVSAGASGNSPSQLDLWSFRDFFRSCRCHIAWDAWCCISRVFLLHFLRMAWYLHVINHANAEASIHTRNTSIITQKGWWWCFSHEEGSSTSASARGSNYILIILRALVIS
jgi:hypothetical protein